METCPACGAAGQRERFCGDCGQLLRSDEPRPEPGAPDPKAAEPTAAPAFATPHRQVPAPDADAERPRAPDAGRRWWIGVAVVAVVALVAALFVALQPSPEVVSAGRWRGDGTGTTSTRAALPDQVLWTSRRLGAGSFDRFRDEPLVVLGRHEDLLLVQTGGYLSALDTGTGAIRWERYVNLFSPAVHDGRVYVPHGPGVATWDAATGEELAWFPMPDRLPFRVVAATRAIVAIELAGFDNTVTAILRHDGTPVGEHEATAHTWDTPEGPRLVLVDRSDGVLQVVDSGTGTVGEPIALPHGAVRAAAGPWVLSAWSAASGGAVINVDTGRRYEVDAGTIADPVELADAGDDVLIFGTSPDFRAPPQGNDLAVRLDGATGSLRPQQLDAGFGIAVGDADGSVLVQTGSLVRRVDVLPDMERVRWERGTDDGTRPVEALGGLVGQFDRDRILAWDTVTGRPVIDVEPRELPGPDRRSEVASQPYIRGDGFVLDASDTLTLVIDPILGERTDVRNSVHVASTPEGDVTTRHDQVQLVSSDGRSRWQLDVEGLVDVAVTDTTVATLSSRGDQAELRTHDLRDGALTGTTSWPSRFVGPLQRVGDRLVGTGDGVVVVDVTVEGPELAWRNPGVVEPDATALRVGEDLVLVGRAVATRFRFHDGEPRGSQRLPRAVAPYTAYRDATVYATAGTGLVAFDLAAAAPDLIWTTDVGSRITSAPTLAGDRLYVGTEDGTIVVLTLRGEIVERLDTGFGQQVVGAPTVANGLVYAFADRGRHLVALGSPNAET